MMSEPQTRSADAKELERIFALPSARMSEQRESVLIALVRTALGGRRLLAITTLAALFLGAIYYPLAPRSYRADTLVQIEEKHKTLSGLDEMEGANAEAPSADTEVEIIRSRAVVGSVVDQLHLDIDASPRFFPIVGRAIADHRSDEGLASPVPGLSSFAWGGERIALDHLAVPRAWELEEKRLKLVAGEPGTYDLYDPDGDLLVHGKVGNREQSKGVEILVSELSGRPGTRFKVTKLPRNKTIEDLQNALSITEKVRKSGIVRIALSGKDVSVLLATLNAVAQTYQRQNAEYRSSQAERTLEFISAQVPSLKANVEAAATALHEYRTTHGGGMDLGIETKAALDRTADVEKLLTETELRRYELEENFTDSHASVAALRHKAAQLRRERKALDDQLKKLPELELNVARLSRDEKVANELYMLLMNKVQELKIMKSGMLANVRILDAAQMPDEPWWPRAWILFALLLVLGLGGGFCFLLVRRALEQGLRDPAAIERESGLPVFATVPFSKQQARKGPKQAAPAQPLSVAHPDDPAVESLRHVRTSLRLALAEAKSRVVAIAGPSPGVGSSFVCVNLGHVLAAAGHRVLLIDADLRNGVLHDQLGQTASPGLSEIIGASDDLAAAVRHIESTRMDLLPRGTLPGNPSELIGSARYPEIIRRVSQGYDVVLVDTAPLLAVADGALAAHEAGMSLVVLRTGKHSASEIRATLRCLEQNRVAVRALILNDAGSRFGVVSS